MDKSILDVLEAVQEYPAPFRERHTGGSSSAAGPGRATSPRQKTSSLPSGSIAFGLGAISSTSFDRGTTGIAGNSSSGSPESGSLSSPVKPPSPSTSASSSTAASAGTDENASGFSSLERSVSATSAASAGSLSPKPSFIALPPLPAAQQTSIKRMKDTLSKNESFMLTPGGDDIPFQWGAKRREAGLAVGAEH